MQQETQYEPIPEPGTSNETITVLTEEKKSGLSLPAAVLTGLALIALAIIVVAYPARKTAVTDTPTAGQQGAPEIPTSVPAGVVTVRANDRVLGDASTAEVLLFEYSDSDCPFCARFHPTTKEIVSAYKGRVALVYRYFPLDMHPNAYTEALALECAAKLGGNDAFWGYLDRVMDVTLNPDPVGNQKLMTFAAAEGIDENAFKTCLADPATAIKIDADNAEAQSIGARGTPFTIAVNKSTGMQVVIPGAYPLEKVKSMIEDIL